MRRLAGKIGRDVVRGYWKKIERVVGYKQRLEGEERRRKDMDRHLVFLVRQTEKYGEKLIDGGGEGGEERQLTIEEALAQSDGIAQRKKSAVDYSRMDKDTSFDESSFYGESIAGHTRMATSPCKVSEDDDYEPTEFELQTEEETERREYLAFLEAVKEQQADDVKEEVDKLLEEMEMDLDSVMRRLMEEGRRMNVDETGDDKPLIEVIGETINEDDGATSRHVSFAPSHEERTFDPSDGGDVNTIVEGTDQRSACSRSASAHSAQDTCDMDIVDDVSEDSEDYSLNPKDDLPDDETTIAAEECLGREMSPEEELAMLQRENEMSVEELRALYADALGGETANNDDDDDSDDVEQDASNEETDVRNRLSFLDEDDCEEKDEFHPDNVAELDDETTIEVEEKLGREMSYADEIAMLQRENEMNVEELRAMYAIMDESNNDSVDDDSDDQSATEEDAGDQALALLDEDDCEEKDEFHPDHIAEVDDETTIEAEEKLGRDMSYADEIELLQRENEMPVEALRAMYANINETESDDDGAMDYEMGDTFKSALALLNEDDCEEKDEFHPNDNVVEVDDETTIAAEEKLGRDMTYEQEISELEQENEMSVEELRKLYGLDQLDQVDESSGVSSKRKHEDDETSKSDIDNNKPSNKRAKTVDDEGLTALQTLAASDAKARETMLTRPFLLANWVKLRTYQHIGLNWLVSVQSRRLNGILAVSVESLIAFTFFVWFTF